MTTADQCASVRYVADDVQAAVDFYPLTMTANRVENSCPPAPRRPPVPGA
jgi:hypothetical protein